MASPNKRRPRNISQLIEMLIQIKMTHPPENPSIRFTIRDVDIIIDILKRTRENVMRHGRTALEAEELILEPETWASYFTGLTKNIFPF